MNVNQNQQWKLVPWASLTKTSRFEGFNKGTNTFKKSNLPPPLPRKFGPRDWLALYKNHYTTLRKALIIDTTQPTPLYDAPYSHVDLRLIYFVNSQRLTSDTRRSDPHIENARRKTCFFFSPDAWEPTNQNLKQSLTWRIWGIFWLNQIKSSF